MRLARISMWRITISIWLFIIIMSYSPMIAHYFFPWFDYSEYYVSVNFLESTAITYFRGLAEQGGVTEYIAQALLIASLALKGIMILLEGVFTGLHPIWVMLGFDQPLPGRDRTLADILSGLLYLFYIWTLYQAFTRGVET